MMKLYNKEYDILSNFLKNKGIFSAILLGGAYGKGKSYLINSVLTDTATPALIVCQRIGMNTPYEAISSALHQWLEENNCTINNINAEISYRDYLKQLFITICYQKPDIIIFFHDMKDYDENTIELIKEILDYLKQHKIACHILMEYSTDNLNSDQRKYLKICDTFCTEEQIMLDNENYQEYTEYFTCLFNGMSDISEEQIKNFIKEAFFNPALIEIMVSYFIDCGIFYKENNCWHCDEIDFHLTAQLFKNHILQRYDKLDEALKNTLTKACITGFEIDTKLLNNPLGIIKSEENLRRIERLSKLIIHTEKTFEFENNTVYNLVSDKINTSEKKAGHLLVAQHLLKKMSDYKDTNSILQFLNTIKNHFLNAEHIDESLYIIACYIHQAYEQRNYDAALSEIKEFLELSSERFPFVEQQFIIKRAEIYRILGQFEKAYKQLLTVNKKFLPDGSGYWIEYLLSYCLFNCGKTKEAKEKAESLIDKFDTKKISDNYLLVKLDIFLAGMYHHFGDLRAASRRYEQGMEIASQNAAFRKEYNDLLAISNMFLDNELAIPNIEKSMEYSKNNQLMISYAKSANNVAINYIYLGDFCKAQEHLKSSKDVFDEIYSISYHYPQNNLATVYGHLGNYKEALKLFKNAKENPVEPFSKIWISMNIANCERKLGNIDECEDILNNVQKDISELQENTYLLSRNYYIANTLLQLDKEEYSVAYENCTKALNFEINKLNNDTYPIYLSQLLISISKVLDIPLPDIVSSYKDSIISSFCKNLLDNHTHWGNLLFWEM